MDKWEYIIQGDIEAALINILRSADEIQDFAGGEPNVSTTLDGYNIGDRWVAVSLEGGSFKWPKIVRSRVDFNVFAETRTVAHDISQTILAVLFREMGQPSPTYGLRTFRFRVETGPVRADDKLTDAPRYVFSLRAHFIPYSGA
jgi:hypothetical protein